MTANRINRRRFLLGSASLAAGAALPAVTPRPARAVARPPAESPLDPLLRLDQLCLVSLLSTQRVADRVLGQHRHQPGECELCDDATLVAFHSKIFFAIVESRARLYVTDDVEPLIAAPLRGPRPDRAWRGHEDRLTKPDAMSAATCRWYRLLLTGLSVVCNALRMADDCREDCPDLYPMWSTASVLYDCILSGADPASIRLSHQALGMGLTAAGDPRDLDFTPEELLPIAVRVGREALA